MTQINDFTEQTTLNDTDQFILQEDSGGTTKKTLWSTIKSTLKTYFDAIYQPLGVVEIPLSSTKTTDYTILDDDGFSVVILSGASANSTFTLPTLADNLDREITLFNNDSTYELNIDGEGSETIDGMTDIDLPKSGNYLKLKAISTGWLVLDEYITSQLWLDTYAGYGSTDTKIMQFTNSNLDIGNLFTHNHGSYSTSGLEITIVKSGEYIFSFHAISSSGASAYGLSVDSTELTTTIQTITRTNKLVLGRNSGSYYTTVTNKGRFDAGQIIRPHCEGDVPGTPEDCGFHVSYSK